MFRVWGLGRRVQGPRSRFKVSEFLETRKPEDTRGLPRDYGASQGNVCATFSTTPTQPSGLEFRA